MYIISGIDINWNLIFLRSYFYAYGEALEAVIKIVAYYFLLGNVIIIAV